MLKDNLIMLRGLHGYSQEDIAGKIGISRQAYAKWESGATVPDIEKCSLLADVYHVTMDSLVKASGVEGSGSATLAPAGKYIWGSITIGDRGQIVIPKDARDKFGLTGGKRLIVLSDDEGIALIPAETFEKKMQTIIALAEKKNESE